MALAQIVQQVLNALGDALAFGLNGFLLRFGIERHEVAGGGRSGELLDGKANAGTGFLVRLNRFSHAHEGARVQQVSRRRKSSQRVSTPGIGRKATVRRLGRFAALGKQRRRVFQVLLL